MVSDGCGHGCTRLRCHASPLDDYNSKHTTTSQEGGAVPEARPLSRVSGAVFCRIFYDFGSSLFSTDGLVFLKPDQSRLHIAKISTSLSESPSIAS